MPGLAPYMVTISLDDIKLERETRQRVDIDELEGLIHSISTIGLLNPIIISRKDKRLIAGERRYTAYKTLSAHHKLNNPDQPNPWARIPFRYFEEITEVDSQIVELIENVHRKELPWRNCATAVLHIHKLRLQANPKHTQYDLSVELGMSEPEISMNLAVGEALVAGTPDFSGCVSAKAAHNILRRIADREASALLADISFEMNKEAKSSDKPLEVSPEPSAPAEPEASRPTLIETVSTPSEETPDLVIQADFIQWAKNYSDLPFNFLHIDFPYGINVGDSKLQFTAQDRIKYEDTPDIYWSLLEALRDNLNTVVSESAHIMFWFSLGAEPDADFSCYERTRRFFRDECGFQVNPFPLIWTKNKAVLPDANRGPRRGYETAFIMSRGDRKIVRPVTNFFNDSTQDKGKHVNEKPIAMLKNFFTMFVDESTRMLDPTAGSGSALLAARSLNPASMLGIELNPEFVSHANSRIREDIAAENLLGNLA